MELEDNDAFLFCPVNSWSLEPMPNSALVFQKNGTGADPRMLRFAIIVLLVSYRYINNVGNTEIIVLFQAVAGTAGRVPLPDGPQGPGGEGDC